MADVADFASGPVATARIESLISDYQFERQEYFAACARVSENQRAMGGLAAKLVAELGGDIERAAGLVEVSVDYLKVIGNLRTEAEQHAAFAMPGWEYATTEGQRKAWDRVDEPPEGEGWVRNTDAGREGWDRFDYIEESYWRRRMPEGSADV